MREAMDGLQKDYGFLMVDEVFTEELVQQWIKSKLETEYYEVRDRPHPYEMRLYFDV